MKVLALGGSGGMGRFSSFAISNYPNISKVTIADLNEANAIEFSNHFDDRFTGIGLDVTNKEHLKKVGGKWNNKLKGWIFYKPKFESLNHNIKNVEKQFSSSDSE